MDDGDDDDDDDNNNDDNNNDEKDDNDDDDNNDDDNGDNDNNGNRALSANSRSHSWWKPQVPAKTESADISLSFKLVRHNRRSGHDRETDQEN